MGEPEGVRWKPDEEEQGPHNPGLLSGPWGSPELQALGQPQGNHRCLVRGTEEGRGHSGSGHTGDPA